MCIISKNGYRLKFCIKIVLNKIHREKQIVVDTVAYKDVYLTLPFLGSTSLKIRTRLCNLFKEKL